VDIVLLDLGLPDSQGIETFSRAHREAPKEPIVVISGLDDEGVALEAVRQGAQDYLVKGRLEGRLLARVIRYAIERKRAEELFREGEERFRQLAENISEVFFVMEAQYQETHYISPAYEQIWGRTCQSLYENPGGFFEALPPESRGPLLEYMARVQQGEHPGEIEFSVIRPDGDVRSVLVHVVPVRNEKGMVYRIAGTALDITARKRAEDALRESERRARTLFETVHLIVLGLDVQGRIDYVNPFFLQLTGYTREEVLGQPWIERFLPAAQQAELLSVFHGLIEGEVHPYHQNAIVTKSGEERRIAWSNTRLRDLGGRPIGTLSIGEDITEQRRLEEQLRHSQKMEAVGRLAGGVAHDFNNLLTAILGHADLLLDDLPPDGGPHADVAEIRAAAERAAGLTRQLLAFSRQQVLQPAVLNVNGVVENLQKLLRRLIGEDVRLRIALAPDVGNVLADVGQLEQVIVNLAVNARDAMPAGGTLTLETANTDLSDDYLEAHQPVIAGSYVMIAVSDTGIGISPQNQARIFEPFFTTKEVGKGTGLGLSTVYGIIKQSGGYIWVYSEPGRGTTFKIYLPRVEAPAESLAPVHRAQGTPSGTETILLAEDDDQLRKLLGGFLQRLGYRVLAAANSEEALAEAAKHAGTIHLLLTDVVMPGESGRQLARRLEEVRPGLRTLYVSGYTDATIMDQSILERGHHYLQKPFTPTVLARRVREVLDSES
jgi:two-component system cell cycle sensor histidine kinase/response regulator CckA